MADSDSEKFLTALDESFQAMVDAIRKGNERGYRFSRRLLNDVEEGQREMQTLARRFAKNPRDLSKIYEDGVDLARRNTRQTGEMARQWFAEASDAGREARSTAQAVIKANTEAAQALGAALRGAANELARNAPRPFSGGEAAAPRKSSTSSTTARKRTSAKAADDEDE
jgi:DNA repair ATPase RecN